MLGEKLLELRNREKLTQEEVAKKLGISRGTYAHYEINRREPDNETLKLIADFYHVSTDYLLGHDVAVKESGKLYTIDKINSDQYEVDTSLAGPLTENDIAIIKTSRKEGLTAKDIELLAAIMKQLKEKAEN